MLNSRSKASTNKLWLGLAALLLVAKFANSAYADRKRVVILPFDGDEKAEKFHGAMVKLVKKSHTVVSTSKWETTAEDLSAAKVSDGNIKKVAKKMKVDGVIEGNISKRRDEYIIKLKLRAGSSGKVIASVNTKAEGTKLDGQASRDIKDELLEAVNNLESVREGGGGDEEEAKPAKKPKKGEDEEEAKPAKKPKKGEDEEEAKPAKKPKKGEDEEETKPSKFGGGGKMTGEDAIKPKKDKEETKEPPKEAKTDEEENPNPKPKKGKKVATKTEDGEEIVGSDDPPAKVKGAEALTPRNRAIDAAVGLSFAARRLSWKTDADLAPSTGIGQGKPPNYNGVPAPGALVDITAFPLAISHKNKSITSGIGVNLMYDQALLISSKTGDGTKLKTASNRFLIGGVFRYPLGASANAPVVGGKLAFGRQSFQIQMGSDLPNVNYTAIQPGAFFKLPVGKLVFNADVGYQLISNTGQMTKGTFYGKAKVAGLDFNLSGDYSLTPNIFARAGIKVERIGYKFDGSGDLAKNRDSDMDPDVKGATDMYIGAAFTLGYLY